MASCPLLFCKSTRSQVFILPKYGWVARPSNCLLSNAQPSPAAELSTKRRDNGTADRLTVGALTEVPFLRVSSGEASIARHLLFPAALLLQRRREPRGTFLAFRTVLIFRAGCSAAILLSSSGNKEVRATATSAKSLDTGTGAPAVLALVGRVGRATADAAVGVDDAGKSFFDIAGRGIILPLPDRRGSVGAQLSDFLLLSSEEESAICSAPCTVSRSASRFTMLRSTTPFGSLVDLTIGANFS
jgi:hypothetical protein